jgi:uncharacterized protein (TIGR02466 family)
MLNSKLFTLWPVPIYKSEIPLNTKWLNFIKKIKYNRVYANNGWMSDKFNLLETKQLKTLKKQIIKHLHNYTYEHLGIKTKFKITVSWAMKHTEGDFAQTHKHTNSVFSGIYYLQTKKDCGDIFFHNKNNLVNMFSLSFRKDNFINVNKCLFNLKDGVLLLFPSDVYHGTERMKVKNFERICLSFNVFIKDNIGINESLLELK